MCTDSVCMTSLSETAQTKRRNDQITYILNIPVMKSVTHSTPIEDGIFHFIFHQRFWLSSCLPQAHEATLLLLQSENEIKEKEGSVLLYFVCWQRHLCSPFSTFCQVFTVKPANRRWADRSYLYSSGPLTVQLLSAMFRS